jgi:hypothetical protein
MLGFKDIGADVCLWQKFLIARGFSLPHSGADGRFGHETVEATKNFQSNQRISPSGALDNQTEEVAIALGFVPQDQGARTLLTDPATLLPSFPPQPGNLQSPSVDAQQTRFGPIEFHMAGDPSSPERIIITNGFIDSKIVNVRVSQLANMTGAPLSLSVQWNRLAVPQLLGLWAAWEQAGLLSRVKTWEGSFVPRCVRGHIGELSNHAFGAAFDINFPWNPLGTVPALVSGRGCVRELVSIANQLGFFWGGHFTGRLDGNHFEVAQVMTENEVADRLGSPNFAAEGLAERALSPDLATYKPNPAALPLLGDIATLIPQAKRVDQGFVPPPKILAVLPGGQLLFDSGLQLDTDGAPELAGDATHQSDTSLHYNNGQPINANRVPYFVLPLPTSWPNQFSVRLGDLAAVIFRGRIGFAVFADFGPKTKLGEGSVELFRRLGEERVRPNGTVRDIGMGPGVITIVFPGSGTPADRENEGSLLAAITSRAPSLFQNLGGVLPTA